MPTEPLKSLLDREGAIIRAKELIDIACPLLQEIINYSTNVFGRTQASAKGEEDVDLAVHILYLHMIQMTDGIEVLISQWCSDHSVPLLRSSFEASLQIEYILKGNTEDEYAKKSLTFLYFYAKDRLKSYERLDTSTNIGREFQNSLPNEDSEWIQLVMTGKQEYNQATIANLNKFLDKEKFQQIKLQYESHKNNPWYYSSENGIRNLCDLAKFLNKSKEYSFLYRYWSSIAHGNDISRFLSKSSKGLTRFGPLRDEKEMKGITLYSANFLLYATILLLKKFRPHEKTYNKWYDSEIRGIIKLLNDL